MGFCKEIFADYNCLTTAEGLLAAGMENVNVTFDMFFREIPDKGGFAVMAGLEQLIEKLKNLGSLKTEVDFEVLCYKVS